MCSYPEATFCSTQTFGAEDGPGAVGVVAVVVVVVAVVVVVVVVAGVLKVARRVGSVTGSGC